MSFLMPYRKNNSALSAGNSLFDDSFFAPFFDMGDRMGSSAFRVDVKEKKDHYELQAELPGVPQDKIEIVTENGYLTISADMNSEKKEEKDNYIYSERRSGHFQRSFNLEGIREEGITAKYENGVLKLELPKEAPVPEGGKQRRIDIQ